ncbi:MAG: hypothetical protein A2991_00330 [Candidatus Terrybacteria bacterium RIFCSPLOWO2_01_FULL_58_14]|uniref:Putative pre-16S rRNA nuclease n=2 Tax=Candidatus Terryibacteriota TaxID=1817920 RepID=A0A1G2PWQ7_9BACT|nr:MAG: hypothetical protein A2682_00340 [Candidatus Terrybacteria bacterium RIFCSPHIGHO2_01_FULL_58_15]OHA52755.1 MAG: hypothetical protein A2991_00330 [Candidatus Terrybacteria bacterium RIFCSPLOWO2_01_FULL_58_14]
MRILGLDYGERRVGVAFADTGAARVALPLLTLSNDAALLLKLRTLIRDRGIVRVVVGLPLTLRGEEGAMAEAARQFGKRLHDNIALPVDFVDERLTTKVARDAHNRDAGAAAAILETWLARSTQSG